MTKTWSNQSGRDFRTVLNPHSLEVVTAKLEASLAQPEPDARFQFERLGYFWPDAVDSKPGQPVFLRTITMKDAWTKEAGKV